MQLNFTIKELCIYPGKDIPVEVADKILNHILVIQPIRISLGKPIWASKHSGYRPIEWELAHGRNGTSQHTFVYEGAVDWTCDKNYINDLHYLLKTDSTYKRICLYPNNNFIHCDFAYDGDGKQLFTAKSPTSHWELIT